MKICVAGAAGAFGQKHLDAIRAIDGIEVDSIVGAPGDDLEGLAKERGIGHWSTELAESLELGDVEAVILATPTQIHTTQAIQCLQAGKHVLLDKPFALNTQAAENIIAAARQADRTLMRTCRKAGTGFALPDYRSVLIRQLRGTGPFRS